MSSSNDDLDKQQQQQQLEAMRLLRLRSAQNRLERIKSLASGAAPKTPIQPDPVSSVPMRAQSSASSSLAAGSALTAFAHHSSVGSSANSDFAADTEGKKSRTERRTQEREAAALEKKLKSKKKGTSKHPAMHEDADADGSSGLFPPQDAATEQVMQMMQSLGMPIPPQLLAGAEARVPRTQADIDAEAAAEANRAASSRRWARAHVLLAAVFASSFFYVVHDSLARDYGRFASPMLARLLEADGVIDMDVPAHNVIGYFCAMEAILMTVRRFFSSSLGGGSRGAGSAGRSTGSMLAKIVSGVELSVDIVGQVFADALVVLFVFGAGLLVCWAARPAGAAVS